MRDPFLHHSARHVGSSHHSESRGFLLGHRLSAARDSPYLSCRVEAEMIDRAMWSVVDESIALRPRI